MNLQVKTNYMYVNKPVVHFTDSLSQLITETLQKSMHVGLKCELCNYHWPSPGGTPSRGGDFVKNFDKSCQYPPSIWGPPGQKLLISPYSIEHSNKTPSSSLQWSKKKNVLIFPTYMGKPLLNPLCNSPYCICPGSFPRGWPMIDALLCLYWFLK